jgi:2-polyprenyl-3-methyl-5-hydroxy-6-metoxy-1,4-benzoquinol methylase
MTNANSDSHFRQAAGAPLNVVKFLYKLPDHIRQLRKDLQDLRNSQQKFVQTNDTFKKHIYDTQAEYGHQINRLDSRLNDVVHQLAIMNEQSTPVAAGKKSTSQKAASDLLADEHLLDSFYVEFERWFRGSDAEIKKRQEIYVPYYTKSTIDSKKYPVIDVGCGRGEFIELMGENNIRAIGLDLNKTMVEKAKQKGLEAVQDDALSYLKKQKSESLMSVTGFHIVEHVPFLDLVKIIDEAYRSLVRGGFVIFETPNPENLIVGACNFWADPSHLHPLPPAFLDFTLKTRGFHKTEVLRLHPIKTKINDADPLVQEMAKQLYGPQNYAIIAYK